MNRGELYRVTKPGGLDPKKYRIFVVVSRQTLIESRFSTVICAPIYSRFEGLSTQVPVGPEFGLKKESAIFCDKLVSLPKSLLTHYVGSLTPTKRMALNDALEIALDLDFL